MAEQRMCKTCKSQPPAPRKRMCLECWLVRQSVTEQARQARKRYLSMPPAFRQSRIPKEDWPVGRRWCSGCQTFVRLRDVRGSRCKTCASIMAHAAQIERTYSITSDEYAALMRMQGGRCYICQRRPVTKRLAVDHNHETGEVRGLLCADNERGCNHAILGNIRDLAMAKRIVEYLESPPARKLPGKG